MQGYVNLFGVITGDNAVSIAMHEKMGYRQVALHERTGWKFGRWHDTVWMHRHTYSGAPRAIVPVHALDAGDVQRLIRETEKKLSEKLKM